jgi:hypothetical protein
MKPGLFLRSPLPGGADEGDGHVLAGQLLGVPGHCGHAGGSGRLDQHSHRIGDQRSGGLDLIVVHQDDLVDQFDDPRERLGYRIGDGKPTSDGSGVWSARSTAHLGFWTPAGLARSPKPARTLGCRPLRLRRVDPDQTNGVGRAEAAPHADGVAVHDGRHDRVVALPGGRVGCRGR